MIDLKEFEVWMITGSQHLYGEETLKQVDEHSKEIAAYLNDAAAIPVRVIFKPVVKTPDEIYNIIVQANAESKCIGLITWMHTFSPAKMWINGLSILNKPLLHLHTQYNQAIPWSSIDMDFMNLNQSAHGDREFGFMCTRMKVRRKVVVGHWKNPEVLNKIGVWTRVASALEDSRGGKIARIADNMREVAVTDGDKVEAQMRFGYSVNGYGIGDVVKFVNEVSDSEVAALLKVYEETYELSKSLLADGAQRASLEDSAKIEIGLRAFLESGNFKGFTDSFEVLHGMKQLPGIATQRLMADGYGFGGEGDWKTSALVRAMKVMAVGLEGGNSFMEDYTYHFQPGADRILGSHMLEICPSIAKGTVKCEVHPLSIGGKEDPARLVFNVGAGDAINASMIDMGDRFRLLVNEVEAVEIPEELPKLPVARVLWDPKPNLSTATTAWILAGGAHHTCYSQNLSTEYMEDFADMLDIELVTIDADTKISRFKNDLKLNEAYYKFNR
ncbi:L-arabinose isomerase [Chondrinema litorale]|uniref:L-arabinose isomerase n=1 Tax=Chondrinema litorale TaxID=2994555 RepID=UPI0025432777|nr:L-arabinose isomerase [Chondrinema litorale]UZR98797.1 L-arabinose isomerase [Chondrinema litorale]